jgi:serine/threonine protein kinase
MKRPFASKADRADMLREYTAVHSLPEHPNVVGYRLFWQESRKLHIQMELCEGGSLDSLLKRHALCSDQQTLSEDMLWLILRYALQYTNPVIAMLWCKDLLLPCQTLSMSAMPLECMQ